MIIIAIALYLCVQHKTAKNTATKMEWEKEVSKWDGEIVDTYNELLLLNWFYGIWCVQSTCNERVRRVKSIGHLIINKLIKFIINRDESEIKKNLVIPVFSSPLHLMFNMCTMDIIFFLLILENWNVDYGLWYVWVSFENC